MTTPNLRPYLSHDHDRPPRAHAHSSASSSSSLSLPTLFSSSLSSSTLIPPPHPHPRAKRQLFTLPFIPIPISLITPIKFKSSQLFSYVSLLSLIPLCTASPPPTGALDSQFKAHLEEGGFDVHSLLHSLEDLSKSSSLLFKRDDNEGGSGRPKVFIPLAIILLILVAFIGLTWVHAGFRQGLVGMVRFGRRNRTGNANRNGGGSAGMSAAERRVLTAAQLTGMDTPASGQRAGNGGGTNGGGNGGNAGGGGATARRNRRGRRPRRTPSQMSVTSLPAYNKEPGDEELVIFRGRDPEDANDNDMRDSFDNEDNEDSNENDNDNDNDSGDRRRRNTNDNTNDNDNDNEYSRNRRGDNEYNRHRDNDNEYSRDSYGMDASTNNLLGDVSMNDLGDANQGGRERRDSQRGGGGGGMGTIGRGTGRNSVDDELDRRGAAPAYFEVVDGDVERQHQGQHQSQLQGHEEAQPQQQQVDLNAATVTRRSKSGFMTFLNRMSLGGNHHHHNQTHNQNSGPVLPTTYPLSANGGGHASSNGNGNANSNSRVNFNLNTNIDDGDTTHSPNTNTRHRANTSTSTYASISASQSRISLTASPTTSRISLNPSASASRLSLFRPLSRQRSTNTLNRSGTPSSFLSHGHSLSHSTSRLSLSQNINNPNSHPNSNHNNNPNSSAHLTSPSLHSLISAPLSHTL
ncbi:hypothetical protein CVT24_001830, partial [Panaeolus cyanescens]